MVKYEQTFKVLSYNTSTEEEGYNNYIYLLWFDPKGMYNKNVLLAMLLDKRLTSFQQKNG